MTTFVDTSALYSLLDEDDDHHSAAVEWLSGPGRDPQRVLVSHSYIPVESAALVHRRLGPDAVRVLFDAFLPALSIFHVDEILYRTASAAYLAGLPSAISFVDRVSFEFMKDRAVSSAFAFDGDFSREGFALLPG